MVEFTGLEMRQHIVPRSRTAENSSKWEVRAEVDGVVYRATSRRGAPQELARVLVAAGVGDCPVRVFSEQSPGTSIYRSLYAMAKFTFTEGKTRSLRQVRWTSPEEIAAAFAGKPQNRGGTPSEVPEVGATVVAAKSTNDDSLS